MDEQNMNNSIPSTNGNNNVAEAVASAPVNVQYAGFWRRFLAVLIDAILVGFVTGFLGYVFGVYRNGTHEVFNPFEFLGIIYVIYMLVKYGATLGKMAMKIRVQNEKTGKNLTVVEALLREVVGKFLSAIVLCLGYLWMLWDPKKQTWHDKIASSVVVKTE